ncbi:MAG: D-alanyl-D-alanine carboxypeptidase family protein [Eubacteriales bacterium]
MKKLCLKKTIAISTVICLCWSNMLGIPWTIEVIAREQCLESQIVDTYWLTNDTTGLEEDTSTFHAISENQLYAKSAVLLDAESGRVLYAKNGQEELPMASTTKILTCILALENGNLDDVVTFSQYAASMPDVQLNANTGESFYLGDLLYSLMLESHNDVAMAIAEHVGGSQLEFANMMNEKAKEIGCESSFFVSPNGLDSVGTYIDENGNEVEKVHSTTAEELALIMRYCIMLSPQKEKFLEITRTASATFNNIIIEEDGSIVTGTRSFSCYNHNSFLSMMEGALSGKTGFTNDAGYCYVGALERDGKTLIVALLGCGWPYNKTYKWSDTTLLMNYGLDYYEFYDFQEIEIEKDVFQPILVLDGQTNQIGELSHAYVDIEEDAEGIDEMARIDGILLQEGERVEVVFDVEEVLAAPVETGKVVGTLTYEIDNRIWKKYHIFLTNSIEKIDFRWCFIKVLEIFYI